MTISRPQPPSGHRDVLAALAPEGDAAREAKATALGWVRANAAFLSEASRTIWTFAEPAWREHRSSAWFAAALRQHGFEVEQGTAGMPTAFRAEFGSGGPVIAAHAEFDAVPEASQAPEPRRRPRAGADRYAAGHTDPHSALGAGALGGLLAAKAAMVRHRLPGRLVFFGEPAGTMCGGQPAHAAQGCYDGLDAVLSFHPSPLPMLANTVLWETQGGCAWSKIYTFECDAQEAACGGGTAGAMTAGRAPGALDAVCLMVTAARHAQATMLPHAGDWTLGEAILAAGHAGAENLPARIGQIQYAWRCPSLEMAERIETVLDRTAEHVAAIAQCGIRSRWVSRTRPGLANRVLAAVGFANLEAAGPPRWGDAAKQFAREIQTSLGIKPMHEPFVPEIERLVEPAEAEALLRRSLPGWQKAFAGDGYTEYTWHAPTLRLHVGRPALRLPDGMAGYPHWVQCATGGHPPTMDPMILKASEVISATIVDLLARPDALEAARAEFRERTGGGIGGTRWIPPLLDRSHVAPVDHRWPEAAAAAEL